MKQYGRSSFIPGIIVLCLSALCLPAQAAPGTGGYPGEFLLSWSGGARGLALGLAQSGLEGQANLSYVNPASVARLWHREAGFSYAPLFGGAQFMSVDYAVPFSKNHGAAVGLARLASDEAEKTNELGETLGAFTDRQTAISLSYGRDLLEGLSAGVSARLVFQEVDTYSARGTGLDAGLLYDYAPGHRWSLVLSNIVPVRLGPDTFPLTARLGFCHALGARTLFWTGDIQVLNAIGVASPQMRWFTGLEYRRPELFAVRAGINQKQVSAGFGLFTRNIDLDYAFVYHQLAVLHMFTLSMRYGFLPDEAEKAVRREWTEFEQAKREERERRTRELDTLRAERGRFRRDARLSVAFIKARELFEAKDFEKAGGALTRILAEDPSHEGATRLLAEILERQDAAAFARRLKDAAAYYRNRKYQEALRTALSALEAQPSSREAQVVRALSQAQLFISDKRYGLAKGELMELLKIEPLHEEATGLLKRVQTILEVYGE